MLAFRRHCDPLKANELSFDEAGIEFLLVVPREAMCRHRFPKSRAIRSQRAAWPGLATTSIQKAIAVPSGKNGQAFRKRLSGRHLREVGASIESTVPGPRANGLAPANWLALGL